jgi:hypothetical protein
MGHVNRDSCFLKVNKVHHNDEIENKAIQLALLGESTHEVMTEFRQPKSTIGRWIKERKDGESLAKELIDKSVS